jgi:hypothetical protein
MFATKVKRLASVSARFDEQSNKVKLRTLQELSGLELMVSRGLVAYVDVLLFVVAMPPDRKVLDLAKRELIRIAGMLSRADQGDLERLTNSGLPHTRSVSKFSHDMTAWLCGERSWQVEVDRFEEARHDLNEVLALTLPSLERSETTSGYENMELLRALAVDEKDEVRFLVRELKKLEDRPRVKDLLFDGLGLYLRMRPRSRTNARAFNAIRCSRPFFHDRILKDFDVREMLSRPLPEPTPLTERRKAEVIRVAKLAMVLTDRETDPVTHMDERSIRYYELERGVSVVIHGMCPLRQLPMESYIGYTLFKNGYPAAYGGAWVFGAHADFGINIFEAFRGGESGYLMCQLLRVYAQAFNVNRFEIEPYQFGLDNPDGIATGAFWFYHKHGFLPTDPGLLELSELEVERRVKRPGHRTSAAVLRRFTGSNMALTLEEGKPIGVYDITDQVKRMIRTRYKGDRTRAVTESVRNFLARSGSEPVYTGAAAQVLEEVALWAEATRVTNPEQLELMVTMIKVKPVDPYRYQDLLLRFFKGTT